MNASNPAAPAISQVVPLSKSAPSAPYALEHLSDSELFDGTRRLIARSNHHLAALLAHLAEVEARGIHRLRACSSLYTYCIYELRLSEDMAYRHARAAKIARRFPILFEQLAAGEIHLTGLLLLGPHLTEENHRAVLLRAKHRSKREIEKLVRQLDPLPDVPERVEPLGPVRTGLPMNNGTWHDFVTSMNVIRELEPGQRPKDWIDSEPEADSKLEDSKLEDSKLEDSKLEDSKLEAELESEEPLGSETRNFKEAFELNRGPSEPDGKPKPGFMPQRYKVQFTASQEYVDLLERARDLLSHAVPNRSIEAVHLRAMRSLVSALEKRRYATTARPRSVEPLEPADAEPADAEPADAEPAPAPELSESNAVMERSARVPRDIEAKGDLSRGGEISSVPSSGNPRQRVRYNSAEVRREVRDRDGARCAYVDSHGDRCQETSFLELHHRDPFARGGPANSSNLAIYCRSHNALAAEQDFGRAHMAQKVGPRLKE